MKDLLISGYSLIISSTLYYLFGVTKGLLIMFNTGLLYYSINTTKYYWYSIFMSLLLLCFTLIDINCAIIYLILLVFLILLNEITKIKQKVIVNIKYVVKENETIKRLNDID